MSRVALREPQPKDFLPHTDGDDDAEPDFAEYMQPEEEAEEEDTEKEEEDSIADRIGPPKVKGPPKPPALSSSSSSSASSSSTSSTSSSSAAGSESDSDSDSESDVPMTGWPPQPQIAGALDAP